MSQQHSWWHWLADLWTPGVSPDDTEQQRTKMDEANRNLDRRQQKLEEIERETATIRRQLQAEAELMHRQWQ